MEVKEIAKKVIKYPLLTEARKRIEELEGEVNAQLKKIDELNSKLSSLSFNALPGANSELDYYIARAVLPSVMNQKSVLQTSVPFKKGYINISVIDDVVSFNYSQEGMFKEGNVHFDGLNVIYPRQIYSGVKGLNKYRSEKEEIDKFIKYISSVTGFNVLLGGNESENHPAFIINDKPHVNIRITGSTDNCGATFVRGMDFGIYSCLNNDPDAVLFTYMYYSLILGRAMCFYSDYTSGNTSRVVDGMLKRVFDELSKTKRFKEVELDRGVAFGSLIHSKTKDTILNPNSSHEIFAGFFGLSSEHADGEDY